MTALALATTALGGCVTDDYGPGGCADRSWTRLEAPPRDAAALGRTADEHPAFPRGFHYWRQYWFAGANGKTMLCRLGDGNARGATWVFSTDGTYLEDESGLWIMSD